MDVNVADPVPPLKKKVSIFPIIEEDGSDSGKSPSPKRRVRVLVPDTQLAPDDQDKPPQGAAATRKRPEKAETEEELESDSKSSRECSPEF